MLGKKFYLHLELAPDLPDVIILLKVIVSLFRIQKLLLSTLLSTLVTAKCACIKNTDVCYVSISNISIYTSQFSLH